MRNITNRSRSIILFILLGIISCTDSIDFDSEKWQTKHDDFTITNARERMLTDLMNSNILINENLNQIIKIIGKPDSFTPEGRAKFLIREKYGTNIDPVYIKYLVIEFNSDGKSISQTIEKVR